jgi:hypothetical protein
MTAIALIIVWALVLGWSPGLSLIAIALTLLALDHRDPSTFDRLRGWWSDGRIGPSSRS